MSVASPVDSILGILVSQSATELRLGTDRAPKMFQLGTQKRLSIPETSEDTLRHLLGSVLTPERERALRENGRVDLAYDAGSLGTFHVTLSTRAEGPGFDAVFLRASSPKPARAAPPPAPPSPATAIDAPRAPTSAPSLEDEAPPAPRAEIAGSEPHGSTEPHAFASHSGLASLVARAAAFRASDVHLLQGDLPSIRVDGRLRVLDDEAPADIEQLFGPVLTPEVRARLAEGRSADLAVDLEGPDKTARVRVNVYSSSRGPAAAIRLLARAAPLLSSLHLPVPLDDLLDLPNGLVVVCGPTGSGKSTTLAALAQEMLRRRPALLISLEDPIEYVLAPQSGLVRQRQVGRDVATFAHGLRDALREDPDLLFIGEMRDTETISLALTAAETGHLVLTSLHSRSTASAVDRILDSYAPQQQQQIRVQLADALRIVISQRLLPRARGTGRVAALEVLRANHSIASLIREGKTAQLTTAMQSARKEGNLPLERCLADLVRAAQITPEAARAVANEPTSLDMYLRG